MRQIEVGDLVTYRKAYADRNFREPRYDMVGIVERIAPAPDLGPGTKGIPTYRVAWEMPGGKTMSTNLHASAIKIIR